LPIGEVAKGKKEERADVPRQDVMVPRPSPSDQRGEEGEEHIHHHLEECEEEKGSAGLGFAYFTTGGF
jgi:hypothetical protein